MIERVNFSRVLVGLEPVIQQPPDRPAVRCLGFDFYQETSQREPSRFFLPTAEAIQWPTMHAPSLHNPLLPQWGPWGPWPGEIHQVPYPVEHRWPGFTMTYDAVVERHFLASVGTWPESLASVAAQYTRHYFDALPWRGHVVTFTLGPPVPVAGDEQSHVPEETIATLVELARQDRYQDFVDLAGAVGVGKAEWDALWRGTRMRVGAPIEEEDPPF